MTSTMGSYGWTFFLRPRFLGAEGAASATDASNAAGTAGEVMIGTVRFYEGFEAGMLIVTSTGLSLTFSS